MYRPTLQINEVISLAVMLLMIVAFVAAEADMSGQQAAQSLEALPIGAIDAIEDRLNVDFVGHLGDKALTISVDLAGNLTDFRGEDE